MWCCCGASLWCWMASKSRDDVDGLGMMVEEVEEGFVRPKDEKGHLNAVSYSSPVSELECIWRAALLYRFGCLHSVAL